MFEYSVLISFVLVGVVIILTKIFKKQWENAPPGPTGLPIIGNLHQLARKESPLEAFIDWREKYGDIIGLHLGQYRVVVLNGYDNIKEAYNTWAFSGRPLLKPFHLIGGGEKRGLILSEGQAWTEQRRFALRNLRDFGFGKKSMESLLQEDITDLITRFQEIKDKPFTPHRMFSTAVVRSLWEIIAGERFKYGDPKFQAVLDGLHSVLSSTSITGPAFFLPWLVDIFPAWTGWTHFKESFTRAINLISEYINEHKRSFKAENIRDFIDVHMKEQQETVDPESSFYKEKGEKHLLVGCVNLLGAGAETTSSTIVWSLLFLINHPEIQRKLYDEINTVIGDSRIPSLDDRESCIYTWAVMEEVLRLSSLAPFGVIHNTMEDTTFKGYFIPKDTIVLANLYGVHYDKKIWGDPKTFRPERFLTKTSEGKWKKKPDAGPVVAFSTGKRVCLGETLARNNFFLYLTSLIQKFEFSSEDKPIPTKGNFGFVRTPKSFSVAIYERDGK